MTITATATIAGLDYPSAIDEFNVRPQPGTVPSEVVFMAQKGTANLPILDVQPDNQGTKRHDGKVYQWFKLQFPDGQIGWLRGHILTIQGDLTGYGYGLLETPVYAYTLTRVTTATTPVPVPVPPDIPPPLTKPVEPTTPTATTPPSVPATPTPVVPGPATPPPPTVTPVPVPVPVPVPQPTLVGKVLAARGAKLRMAPVSGEELAIIPCDAIVIVLDVQSVSGEQWRWVNVSYQGQAGWTREDLMSYSGDGSAYGLPVTSTEIEKPVEFKPYTDTALYPVPMKRYRFVRGYTGPEAHNGVDYGADTGEPMLAGPVGGLAVESYECSRCNVPDKPSTVLQGWGLGSSDVFFDPTWGWGYGHFVIVRYLHNQLPPATRQSLAGLGLPGAHIYALYGHLASRTVTRGQVVEPFQQIGTCGDTGNSHGAHLHLELRASTNPVYSRWALLSNGLVDPLIMFQK